MQHEHWKQEVLDKVLCLIAEQNGGHWPRNVWQWRRVARRFGVTLTFLRVEGPFTACLRDDLLLVRWTHQPCAPLRWLVHEICEAILLWEGEPEYRHPLLTGETEDALRHRIACTIENLMVASQ